MTPAAELLAFAGVMAVGQFSPGPDMLLLTRTALAEGARSGVAMAVGIGTGLSLHAAVAIGGTAALFERGGWPAGILRWAAVLYLGWLGYGLVMGWFVHVYSGLRYGPPPPRGRRGPYVRGLLCNLLNPKVMVFLAAVAAPFLKGDRAVWWPWALWGVVVGEGLLLWAMWALVLQWRPVRDGYRRGGPWIDLGFGLLLLALALRLAWGGWVR